jgi:hypothetical protein
MVDSKVAGGHLLHDLQNEVDEMIVGQPLAQITGQKLRRLAIKINKAGGHENQSRPAAVCLKHFQQSFGGQVPQSAAAGMTRSKDPSEQGSSPSSGLEISDFSNWPAGSAP